MPNSFVTAADLRATSIAVERHGLGRAIRLGAAALLVFFVGLGGAAALIPLDAAVVAPGVVIVAGRSEIIASPDGGRVLEVFVKEGDEVEAGRILMRLDAGERAGEVAAMRARKIELEAQQAQLLADESGEEIIAAPENWTTGSEEGGDALLRRQQELAARRSALRDDLEILDQRLAQIDAQIRGLAAQRTAVDEQARIVDEEIRTLAGLIEKGLATAPRLRQAERLRAELSERNSGIAAEIAALKEKIAETHLQKSRLRGETAIHNQSELSELDRLLSELVPRLEAAEEAVSRLDIRASVSGRVMSLAARNAGDVVAPGEAILEIVPDARRLVIEARVDPRDADDLAPGMASEVRLTGIGGRTAFSHAGQVVQISPDRVLDERTRESWFTVQVDVSDFAIGNKTLYAVRPGLPADVMIPLRKRTALDYLLEPLNQTLWRSMRED